MSSIPSYRIVDMDAHPPLMPLHVDFWGEMDAPTFFERLERAQIGEACGTPVPPPDFFKKQECSRCIAELNEGAMALAAEYPNYHPVVSVHPDCAEFSVGQLKKYRAEGVNLLEIEAQWLNRAELDPILECAQSLGMTAVLQGETMAQARETAKRFPALGLLVGARRSKSYLPADAHKLMQECPNVGIILSGVIWLLNYGLHEWTQRLGEENLFFGTGYPLCNPAAKRAAVQWELRDQPSTVAERLLSKNARCLLDKEYSGAEGGKA